jgi:uncharacterized protein (TIGR02145 family)
MKYFYLTFVFVLIFNVRSIGQIIHQGDTLQLYPTQYTNIIWGPTNSQLPGPWDSQFGKNNSANIVNALGNYNSGNYAAKLCENLTGSGYSDWYLPTLWEGIAIATSGQSGGTGSYWTSFQSDASYTSSLNQAAIYTIGSSNIAVANKNAGYKVQCVRRIRTGCMDISACNYDQFATLPGSCYYDNSSTETIVACGSYTWINGVTYNSSNNTATHTLTNIFGCDSIVTLNLTILNPVTSSFSVTQCDNPYTWNTQTYYSSGVYSQTFQAVNGCDSTVTLYLTINNSNESHTTASAFGNYTWNGQNYTTSGLYSYNTTNLSGCDSIAYLHLVIDSPTAGTLNISASTNDTICQNQSVNLITKFYGDAPGVLDVEFNYYDSRIIGTQEWMSENLNVSRLSNGDTLWYPLNASGNYGWTAAGSGGGFPSSAYVSINYDSSNDTTYGKLYNFYAANDSRNVCPVGWHVSTNDEWNLITNYLGGSSIAGDKLKDTLFWQQPNTNSNESNFTALPSGSYYVFGSGNTTYLFTTFESEAHFWTSTQNLNYNSSLINGGYSRTLDTETPNIYTNDFDWKRNGYSIRCLKNSINGGIQYQWNTGQTTSDISVNPSVTTTYTCTVTAYGITYVDSITIYVIDPIAQISAIGPTNYCTGQNVTLFATPVQNATYQWKKNNVNISGAINSTYTTPTNSSASGNYTVGVTLLGCTSISNAITVSTYTNSYSIYDTICGGPFIWNGVSYNNSGNFTQTFPSQSGCDSVVTLHLIVYPNNFNPTFSSTQQLFTSPPFAVQFSNATTNPSNYNFTWYWGDGTSTTSNNATVFHEYLTNGLYTVTLEATSIQTGCSDETTITDYIYTTGGVSCTHSATINQSGPITACSGQSVVLSCNSSPSYTYQWRKNGVYISGSNNDTLIVTQPGAYSVIISENGCPVSSNAITVNFAVIQTPVINSTGSIQPCVGGSVTLNTTTGFNSYIWSNGATTSSTSVNTSGNYTVQVSDANGCTANSLPYTVNASILPTQNICVVGVDSVTNNMRVVWEKPISTAIDSFYIYKETTVANVYTQVGSRHYDSLSVWIDPLSNPAVQAYRYKLTALDTCGSETPLSDYHKSIHLTINQGVGGSWNLIWSNYEGINFGSYNIYRGTSLSNLTLLTSIQSNLNSYTDLSPPSGNVYYQIEILNPNNCSPTKVVNYSSSKSNIVTNSSIGLTENTLESKVYPNPVNDVLYVVMAEESNEIYFILDSRGRKVLEGRLNGTETQINLKELSNGAYMLKIGEQKMPIRVIKQ